MREELVIVLHNIRSLHNVGSVLRTADGAGVAKVYMTGYTPSPTDEMGRVRKEIAKTALGAENSVAWECVADISRLITKLKKEGFSIVALEQSDDAKDYREFYPQFPVALIAGNEVRGLSGALLEKVDASIVLPMRGKKESLNVSVAVGVAVYKLTDTR
ncbi:MAG: TrmH family RNA methyltransferase [Candidatus Ryanbacteria bacterium]|nr:TrmH family RNA methyltransferase [Candidatus Ryanbacteria bacterium]